MREPIGAWQPSTAEQNAADTDFENEALRREVEKDGKQLVNDVSDAQPYLVGETAHELEPKTLRGLLDAKPE